MYFYLCEKIDKKAVITDLATAYLGFNSFTSFTPIHPGVNRDHPFRAVVSKTTFRARKAGNRKVSGSFFVSFA